MRLIVDSPDPSLPRECNLHVRPKKRSMLVFSEAQQNSTNDGNCKLQAHVEIVAGNTREQRTEASTHIRYTPGYIVCVCCDAMFAMSLCCDM